MSEGKLTRAQIEAFVPMLITQVYMGGQFLNVEEQQEAEIKICCLRDLALSALTARTEGFFSVEEPDAMLLRRIGYWQDRAEKAERELKIQDDANEILTRKLAALSPRETDDGYAKAHPSEVDALGEQPTYFEMTRTRMLRKRIADIVATHDAFVADHKNKERAKALKHAIDKARGIGLTKAEQEKQEDYDCPHAYPHRYCETCKVDPCPLGLKRPPPPERP